ncbi:MAG: hypothetical protein NTY02_18940, partial [Acidobacteria bacterium]|nr:hypothetical protein [Acidobacteriota bacterium]
MKQSVRLMLVLMVAVLVAVPAFAQDPPVQAPKPDAPQVEAPKPAPEKPPTTQWAGRGFFNVSGMYQSHANSTVSTTSTSTVYDETATLTSAQTIKSSGGSFDISGGVRVWKNLGVGVGYSQMSTTGDAAISAKVPHPIYYDQPRTANATASGLKHEEQQIHIFALWMLTLSPKLDVAVFGGPSVFNLKQGTIAGASYTEVGSPYTQINLTYQTAVTTKSQVGGNVGVDVTYKITK